MREWANLVQSSSIIICGRTLKPTAIVIAPLQLIHHRCGLLAWRGTFGYLHSSATKTAAALIGAVHSGTYRECTAAMAGLGEDGAAPRRYPKVRTHKDVGSELEVNNFD